MPLSEVIFYLNDKYGSTPAIDETGDSSLVVYGLRQNEYTDLSILKSALNNIGLQINRENRTVEMLVISPATTDFFNPN